MDNDRGSGQITSSLSLPRTEKITEMVKDDDQSDTITCSEVQDPEGLHPMDAVEHVQDISEAVEQTTNVFELDEEKFENYYKMMCQDEDKTCPTCFLPISITLASFRHQMHSIKALQDRHNEMEREINRISDAIREYYPDLYNDQHSDLTTQTAPKDYLPVAASSAVQPAMPSQPQTCTTCSLEVTAVFASLPNRVISVETLTDSLMKMERKFDRLYSLIRLVPVLRDKFLLET